MQDDNFETFLQSWHGARSKNKAPLPSLDSQIDM